jgi:hypothetical protein
MNVKAGATSKFLAYVIAKTMPIAVNGAADSTSMVMTSGYSRGTCIGILVAAARNKVFTSRRTRRTRVMMRDVTRKLKATDRQIQIVPKRTGFPLKKKLPGSAVCIVSIIATAGCRANALSQRCFKQTTTYQLLRYR